MPSQGRMYSPLSFRPFSLCYDARVISGAGLLRSSDPAPTPSDRDHAAVGAPTAFVKTIDPMARRKHIGVGS